MTSLENKRDNILNLIMRYGGIDGEHHKTWVIDQIVRELAPDYDKWVEEYRGEFDEDYGDYQYDWDEGTPP